MHALSSSIQQRCTTRSAAPSCLGSVASLLTVAPVLDGLQSADVSRGWRSSLVRACEPGRWSGMAAASSGQAHSEHGARADSSCTLRAAAHARARSSSHTADNVATGRQAHMFSCDLPNHSCAGRVAQQPPSPSRGGARERKILQQRRRRPCRVRPLSSIQSASRVHPCEPDMWPCRMQPRSR